MINVIHAYNKADKQVVYEAMKKLGPEVTNEVFGFWKDGICIGGMSVSKYDIGHMTISIGETDPIELMQALQIVFSEMFTKHTQLIGRVHVTNTKSKKLLTTLGAEVLYIDGEWLVYHLTKSMWRLQSKWPLS